MRKLRSSDVLAVFRWPHLLGATLIAVTGGVVGSVVVWFADKKIAGQSPEWWAASLAGIGLSAAAFVGYVDRILIRHRVVLTLVAMRFQADEITPEILLANVENRPAALVNLHLAAGGFGRVAYGAAAAIPRDEYAPVVLAPGDMRYVTRRYRYQPKPLYALQEIGEMIDEGAKRVEWKMAPLFINSFGQADTAIRQVTIWKQELTAEGSHGGGGTALYPIVVPNSWHPLGSFGPS